jgi:signal peptidase I
MLKELFHKVGEFIYETLQTIVIFASVFVFVYFFAVQPHQIQGDSMLPNFIDSEYILTDKISYRFNAPSRGEVVVFKAPNDERKDYIKRIIAIPGETVAVRNNTVFVDEEPLPEGYLSRNEVVNGGAYLAEGSTIALSSGQYFVLGDNRDQSQDSRSWGPIGTNEIVGKVFFRYWPPKAIGKVEAVTYLE